jgi:uncharacterized membrane protein (UPF0136 family)
MANIILWIYIGLLLVGGFMGFVKAGSKVSLVSSAVFAVLLALCAAQVVPWRPAADVLLVLLLVVFVMRFVKTKKFMPAGLMIAFTAIALVLHLVAERSA